MFANFAAAIPSGAAITFMLLFAMHSLISMQPGIVAEPARSIPFTWLHVPPQEDLNTDAWEKPELREIEHPPVMPQNHEFSSTTPILGVARVPAPPPGPVGPLASPYMSDGPLVAMVRVEPTYPPSAAQRGLEGFVIVRFDVLADGTVGNIAVVQSSSSVFERAAIRAASRFRFKARVIDGVPQAVTGIQYQFRFEMER